jgi:heat shock protein HslJ
VPPTPLEGTKWVGSGTIANEAVTVSAVGSQATLTITDGQAQINTGCNTGTATVEITDTTMTFGPMALTRKACAPDLTELEASVVLVLDGEVTYEITGDMLSIRKAGDNGDVGLNFTAA